MDYTKAEHKLYSISKLFISQVIIEQVVFVCLFVVVVFSLFIFRGHSTRESASSRVTYFILQVNTGKKLGEVLEKLQVNGLEG